MTRLIDAGEFLVTHQHRRFTEINATPVSFYEWHPKDSIPFELTDNKHLLVSWSWTCPVSSKMPEREMHDPSARVPYSPLYGSNSFLTFVLRVSKSWRLLRFVVQPETSIKVVGLPAISMRLRSYLLWLYLIPRGPRSSWLAQDS